VDAQNHVAYNVFPKLTPPKLYERRGQWQAAADAIPGTGYKLANDGTILALSSTIWGTATYGEIYRACPDEV